MKTVALVCLLVAYTAAIPIASYSPAARRNNATLPYILDISVLPQIMEGDVVMCTVHADAGETQDCATPVEYAANGYSASFTCAGELAPQAIAHGRCPNSHVIVAGTTLQYKCSMSQV